MKNGIMKKERAPRNRTMIIDEDEKFDLLNDTIQLNKPTKLDGIVNRIIHQNLLDCLDFIPDESIDLLVLDPPYNLDKLFGNTKFKKSASPNYAELFEKWIVSLKRCLKVTATIYVCADWRTSAIIYPILDNHFIIRNRITWEREKGRGAKTNWKNCSEDIWFCTISDDYCFDVESVKLKKRVIAPYKDNGGTPKDWNQSSDGKFRLTYPSNLWSDISIPFWSMPENTEHPTQKPEKLIAKLVMASSRERDVVLDPFLGSGTTAVVAKKLRRQFIGVEQEEYYCQVSIKRLRRAESDKSIQGYHDGCFWERNSLVQQKKSAVKIRKPAPLVENGDFFEKL